MEKVKVLFLAAVLSIFILGGIGYAMTGMINAAKPAVVDQARGAEVVDNAIADEAAKKGPDSGTPLASNAAMVKTNIDLLGKIAAIAQEDLAGAVTLSDAVRATTIPGDVQDPIGYTLNLAVVGGVKIAAVGNTYNVEESTAQPVIFAAEQVLADPVVFAETVDTLEGGQFAVVLSSSDEERAAVEGLEQVKTRGEKVVVAPTVLDSNTLLTAILKEAVKRGPVGISLRDALETPAVAAARKGAV